MRAFLILLSISIPATASAQSSIKCEGQTFAELAEGAFKDARLGPAVAIFNGKRGEERCTEGRFIRFPATIRHELALGQTVTAVAERFCRASGAEAMIREKNNLAGDVDPPPGTILQVPSELELQVGTRPEDELSAIFGLPDLSAIKRYNGVDPSGPLPPGGTIYVPLFLELRIETAPPPPVATSTVAPRPSSTGNVEFVATRDGFRHEEHRALMGDTFACALCHRDDPARPNAYRPIAEEACNACHRSVSLGSSGLRADRLALTFSHDLHLDPERKVKRDGYKLDCAKCHVTEGDGVQRQRAAHTACIECHNPSEAKPVVASDCNGCHAAEESIDRLLLAVALLDEHYRGSVRGTDITFSHAAHDAPCEQCHATVPDADSLDQIEPQRMNDCLRCHRGLEKELASASVSLDRCRTCHVSRTEPTAPQTHTRAFRLRHAREAERDRGTCTVCHTELAGGDGARCDRCHSRTSPEDHTVRWREEPHGRAAVRNPDRCATCHQRDRCASCHAIAPRDHTPLSSFLLRHNRSARTSTRRCLTCHIPQVDCAPCHQLSTF
jgi:hypothetical protein